MITVDDFWSALIESNVTFFSGVPCSLLKNILTGLSRFDAIRYVDATREDAALGLASGVSLCGIKSGILIQNSGLGNIINGVSSLNLIYKIPVLIIVTWRGSYKNDAPEHIIIGKVSSKLLRLFKIPVYILETKRQIKEAVARMDALKVPVAIMIKELTTA
ncbi:MAG: thiamine pyrophosphate-binding protein [Candidatus Omnitrophica bacterium]|nr:thiamine pyrophosphate-binding protein [Candidatus Omnitrophota bacterium]